MVFYVNDKREKYNPYNMVNGIMLGEKSEVRAYKVGNDVIKFYKPNCSKIRMDKVTCESLSKIYTHRIKLPKATLLDKKRHIRGYKMDYIDDFGEKSFYNLSKKNLLEEMKLLHDDLLILSDNGVLIDDLNHENTIYNKGLYLIDPGSYTISEEDKRDSIKTYCINKEIFNTYLLYDIVKRLVLSRCKNNKRLANDIIINMSKNMYNINSNPLDYFSNKMEYNNIDDMVDVYLKKVKRK